MEGLFALRRPMGDAPPGRACPAAEGPARGGAAPAGGPAGVRRSAAGAGVGEFGVAVVADVSTRRAAGPAAQADPGPTAAVVRGAAAPAGEDPGAGAAPGGLPHGSLDPGAGGQGDPAGVRDSVSPQPCLEAADRPRLEVPAVRAVRGGAADAAAPAGAGAAPGWAHPGLLDLRRDGLVVPSGVRDSVSPQPYPESADRPRLEVPAAQARCWGTRRSGHRLVGVGRMALA